jgi:hypothetical protein
VLLLPFISNGGAGTLSACEEGTASSLILLYFTNADFSISCLENQQSNPVALAASPCPTKQGERNESSVWMLLQVATEFFPKMGMAEFTERDCLYLANTLTGNAKLYPNLF